MKNTWSHKKYNVPSILLSKVVIIGKLGVYKDKFAQTESYGFSVYTDNGDEVKFCIRIADYKENLKENLLPSELEEAVYEKADIMRCEFESRWENYHEKA